MPRMVRGLFKEAKMFVQNQNRIEISMMTVALGQSLGFNELAEAKRIQKLMMDWINADDAGKRSIYRAFRNEGSGVAGLDAS